MKVLPQHVAIVMDGNGRWAKQRKLPRIAGHRAGAKSVKKVVECCIKQGVKALTLFALSVENFQHRPRNEVQFLISLFLESLQNNTKELHDNNVRIRVIGDLSVLNAKLREQVERSQVLTANNNALNLVVAINYSGRWDLLQASQKIAEKVHQSELTPSQITEQTIANLLCSHDLPEPDLLIRTSGEQRISNFMLWQFAYTELYFTDIFWPDFDEAAFMQALQCYQSRQRRFGLTGEQVEATCTNKES